MHASPDVCFHDAGDGSRREPWTFRDGLQDAEPDTVADLGRLRECGPLRLSVVIPTRNEEANVAPLLERLGPAVAPLDAEIIFVDDSDDGTPEAINDSALTCPVPIRMLHRPPGARTRGLSGAVITGARHARGAWVLVMDADLQHPPDSAAALASTAMRHDADIVVGTRYAGHGSPGNGLGGIGRTLVSTLATRLVKSSFPRRLAMVSDPLSGLFAFRTAAVDLGRLSSTGFKILLEILVRHPSARVAEAAYRFAPRHAGGSKASVREGLAFLRQVTRLRLVRLAGNLRSKPASRRETITQVVRMAAFGVIGITGLVVNTAALWVFYHKLGLDKALGATLATQASTTWNFLLVDSIVYRHRANGTRLGRASRFYAMNNLLLLARLPVLELLVMAGLGVLWANGFTLVLLFLVRFLVSDRAIFLSPAQDASRDPVRVLVDVSTPAARHATATGTHSSPGRQRSRYLAYRYDLAGVVTIGSQIMLPELEFFRAQWVSGDDVDITVRVADVGGRGPHRRAAMTEYANPALIRYEEHLGRRLGANFRAHFDERITVEVGPMLARSPHVVYTNIVEALLRFVMVTRGRMLLHSACVELDGHGLMLSALTDTGKTGTVLRLLREHGARFLSDDMTVIDSYGNAYCFPKPLTISSHTVRAVRADDLTSAEWRKLRFQSRLHSKGGRSFAVALSRFNVPILSINALTQRLVPPPKYTADRLVPCRMSSSTRVRDLFIIERGRPRLAEVDHGSALEQLLTNTDDAYGFPPFRHLAPAITIGGRDCHELRRAESDILAGFLAHVHTRVLASDSFSWADDIPRLIHRRPALSGDFRGVAADSNGTQAEGWPHWSDGLAYGGAV